MLQFIFDLFFLGYDIFDTNTFVGCLAFCTKTCVKSDKCGESPDLTGLSEKDIHKYEFTPTSCETNLVKSIISKLSAPFNVFSNVLIFKLNALGNAKGLAKVGESRGLYMFINIITLDIYIGHTTKFVSRIRSHKSDCRNKERISFFHKHLHKFGFDKFLLVFIPIPWASDEQLKAFEVQTIAETSATLNTVENKTPRKIKVPFEKVNFELFLGKLSAIPRLVNLRDMGKCVYLILNNITGEYYIGKAVDLGNRMSKHLGFDGSLLKDCPKLYHAFSMYGIQSFSLYILESGFTSDSELASKENDYINSYQPSLNSQVNDDFDISESKINPVLNQYTTSELNSINVKSSRVRNIPIYVYSVIDNKFLYEFGSTTEAAEFYGINQATVSKYSLKSKAMPKLGVVFRRDKI